MSEPRGGGSVDATSRNHSPDAQTNVQETRRADLQRQLIAGLVGQKISLSTTDQHFLVGRLSAFGSDDRLKILVKHHEVYVRRQGVARIHAADPALAEFLK